MLYETPTLPDTVVCKQCQNSGKKRYEFTKSGISRHLKTHFPSIDPYYCEVCGEYCCDKAVYRRHRLNCYYRNKRLNHVDFLLTGRHAKLGITLKHVFKRFGPKVINTIAQFMDYFTYVKVYEYVQSSADAKNTASAMLMSYFPYMRVNYLTFIDVVRYGYWNIAPGNMIGYYDQIYNDNCYYYPHTVCLLLHIAGVVDRYGAIRMYNTDFKVSASVKTMTAIGVCYCCAADFSEPGTTELVCSNCSNMDRNMEWYLTHYLCPKCLCHHDSIYDNIDGYFCMKFCQYCDRPYRAIARCECGRR